MSIVIFISFLPAKKSADLRFAPTWLKGTKKSRPTEYPPEAYFFPDKKVGKKSRFTLRGPSFWRTKKWWLIISFLLDQKGPKNQGSTEIWLPAPNSGLSRGSGVRLRNSRKRAGTETRPYIFFCVSLSNLLDKFLNAILKNKYYIFVNFVSPLRLCG